MQDFTKSSLPVQPAAATRNRVSLFLVAAEVDDMLNLRNAGCVCPRPTPELRNGGLRCFVCCAAVHSEEETEQ